MKYGRIPNNHKDQALPPDQRSPPDDTTISEATILARLTADHPNWFIGSNGFFRERDTAFRPEMDVTDINDFLRKYHIAFPTKCRLTYWTFVYSAVLCGRIGGEGSQERAVIWLWHHKTMKVVEWSTKNGIYQVNGKKYRHNYILRLRRPNQ